jgi:hypothetical protein
LTCPTSGDVLLSAQQGYEFADWGGQAHVGGGSHGSLRAEDSLAPLIFCGLEGIDGQGLGAASDAEREMPGGRPWSIKDVAPAIVEFFGVAP